jgi:hypothetical protein
MKRKVADKLNHNTRQERLPATSTPITIGT